MLLTIVITKNSERGAKSSVNSPPRGASWREILLARDGRDGRARLVHAQAAPRRISRDDSRCDLRRRCWSANILRPLLNCLASEQRRAPPPRIAGRLSKLASAWSRDRSVRCRDEKYRRCPGLRCTRRNRADKSGPCGARRYADTRIACRFSFSVAKIPGFAQSNFQRVRYCEARLGSVGEPSANGNSGTSCAQTSTKIRSPSLNAFIRCHAMQGGPANHRTLQRCRFAA